MARKRSLDEGPVIRGNILAAAAELFYERGYGTTSIRDIAEAAGIASSTLYHHFVNKQAILHAIVIDFMTDFVAATSAVLTDSSLAPKAKIAETVRLHIEMSDERRPELLIGNPIRYALSPDQQRDGVALQATYHGLVRETIAVGVRDGDFTVLDDNLAAMAVLDMLNGIREWFNPVGGRSREELVRIYTTMVFALLGADSASAVGGRADRDTASAL
ncbi:TetR/AcrR family transcriptional regulator [Rhodococcus opacus]|uniref:TetR/AcrR family transcriptional regulator n=1 Tax=Rhodococcus opacus TaxID=37919 RepID=UPI001F5A6961|nr:TetR/AcrR family transcriptional regulator [Rhodococcus opacus]UNN05319.1 TetR/AcrR family transcriptional regulator [Rhodococcus opacus]